MGIVVAALVGQAEAQDPAPCATTQSCIKACEAGKVAACDYLRMRFTAMCEEDVAEACGALGDMYWEGYASTTISVPTGTKMYRKACELGSGGSCNQWAFALAYGNGVKRDDARAVTVWKRGCELDDGLSCTTYGGRLWLGRSVERNYAVAGEISARRAGSSIPPAARRSASGMESKATTPMRARRGRRDAHSATSRPATSSSSAVRFRARARRIP